MLPVMRFLPSRTTWSVIIVVCLVAILAVLAVLQYIWSGEVSEAERERMQASLRTSTLQFRQEFNRDLQQLVFAFQPDAAVISSQDWRRYASNLDDAFNNTDRRIVSSVYLWVSPWDDGEQLLKFDRQTKSFETVGWVPALDSVRERYPRTAINQPRLPSDVRPFAWTMLARIPLLVHPLFVFQQPAGPPMANSHLVGYLMLELSMDAIREDLLSELGLRYFGGPEGFSYDVAIVSGPDVGSIIYKSDPKLVPSSLTAPDARIPLLDAVRTRAGRWPTAIGGDARAPDGTRPPPMALTGPPQPRQGRGRGGPILFSDSDGAEWDLVVKNRQGSLEAVVDHSRRRNLGISFGILLLLATSMTLIIGYSQRTQRLAQLQMDFVAGVSHELRTPLAVICSAGENLADGVVADSNGQIRQYGELIREEGWKLKGVVDQVLQFASIQRGRRQYNLQPIQVQEICEDTLAKESPRIQAAGFEIENDIARALPLVNADASALSQCIQDLIANALKYSGDRRWLAVRTGTAEGKNGLEVLITVEDKGIGIDPSDVPHIFEPFYRGQGALASQIHGTGLGLCMVRKSATAMGGDVTVKSSPGKGSIFTIHLPAMPPDAVVSLAGSQPS
jgi:signal transduction histidine kinase